MCPTSKSNSIMRFVPQQRALYCYIALMLWIFLLVAESEIRNLPKNLKSDAKTKRIFKFCNYPEEITIGSEGQVDGNFSLEGVLVVFRHGDRGPLAHVRNVSTVMCGPGNAADRDELQSYMESIINSSQSPGFPQFLGPFHSFPLLPPDGGEECGLGQLTGQGIVQLRRTGYLLRKAYSTRLLLDNLSLGPSIAVHSTRYRRTFQSALALLHSLVSPLPLTRAVFPFHEAHSLAFCFADCACPSAEILRKQAESESSNALKSHPAVGQLARVLASAVFDGPVIPKSPDPRTVHDSLLAYACHNAQLPCATSSGSRKNNLCVRTDHVKSLFTYVDWEARRLARSLPMKRVSILRAYGLLHHMVGQLLRLVSADRRLPPSPRMVLYSGHDRTLQYLTGALGVAGGSLETAMPPYASRLVVELYRDNASVGSEAKQYLFRLLFNGRDLTGLLHFCRTSLLRNITDIYETTGSKKINNALLCPLESIVRYLHDDYFSTFNATNFKDSCSMHF
ncbi:hypothetical protein B566_EDAN013400 [Ephemera danica]|nr:hypothetical protein B566_EDAN013400 [Ephemera danica]